MEDFVRELLYPFIGWAYLWIRYRNKEKVQAILKEKYSNSYHDAGATKILHFIGIVFIVILAIFLVAVIYGVTFA